MESNDEFRPGYTQQTAVKVAKDITTAMLELLGEYGSVLEQLDRADLELNDPLDYYDDLFTTYAHI